MFRDEEQTMKLAKEILAARNAGKPWSEVHKELGVEQSRGLFLLKVAAVKPSERITYKDNADLKRQAQALRKQGVSKADIAARAGLSLIKFRKVLGDEPAKKPAPQKTRRRKAATKEEA
jgi:hypothetical protein